MSVAVRDSILLAFIGAVICVALWVPMDIYLFNEHHNFSYYNAVFFAYLTGALQAVFWAGKRPGLARRRKVSDDIIPFPQKNGPVDRPYPTADCDPNSVQPIAQIEVGGLGFSDINAAFNMRDWLQDACEARGAKIVGGGFGMGQADLDVELEGCRFNLSIRPI